MRSLIDIDLAVYAGLRRRNDVGSDIHQYGATHKDVKPENALLCRGIPRKGQLARARETTRAKFSKARKNLRQTASAQSSNQNSQKKRFLKKNSATQSSKTPSEDF
jgi:hypothetical protein